MPEGGEGLTRRMCVLIHRKTYEDLVRLHARTGETVSVIIRRALVQYLSEQQAKEEQQR
jgi:hypothetical protein